ncbi:GNAT family N-acetyltransferase [uncultured Pelagimonas sp.]|uniref:GNAT family N-acetyltransferase n=1 Tax=uncultured Pelagimonas sp. TaxID=1618102 RepID=UPI00260EA578|nr:GNAT family N-acetyltransferase [uncultured Pelagimonas sp.]
MLVVNPPLHNVLPLFRALHNFHVCLSPFKYHAEGSDADYLSHLQTLADRGAITYAIDAGWGLVAYLLALPEDIQTDGLRWGGRRMKTDHLYIAPTHRGQRLGHRLVDAMETEMRAQGITNWVVTQDATNQGAKPFYHAVGAVDQYLVLRKTL